MQGESTLERLKKASISATDIAGQFWCERQMEYNYLYGERFTEQMRRGKMVHAELQKELFVPLAVEPLTYIDRLYKTAYENYNALLMLKKSGACRELRIYGSLNGYRISGQIDELRMERGRVIVVENKTRESAKPIDSVGMRPHKVQVMLYRRLLSDIRARRYAYENFATAYRLNDAKMSDEFVKGLKTLGIKDELLDIRVMYKRMFEEFYSLPELSDRLELHYINRLSGELLSNVTIAFTDKELDDYITYAFKYWNGERESAPVIQEESWKCNFCKFFGKQCTVWYKGSVA